MTIRRSALLLCIAVTAMSFAVTNICTAEPPSIFRMFKPKKSLKDAQLTLKPEHGPWLILAATLTGADAETKANALARELRASLRLPCFVMTKTIGSPENLAVYSRKLIDQNGQQSDYKLKLKYANGSQEQRAFAVLVGEFTSIDDTRLTETLKRVRYTHPQTLAGKSERQPDSDEDESSWVVKQYRSLIWSRTDRESNRRKGKLGAAFATRNPLLPDDFFQPPKVDKFVEALNRESWVSYSLLDCPGRFTVRVASFEGKEVTDFGNGHQASRMDGISDALDRAAQQANKLTVALRKKGEEAYEFHDKFGSYVTIGSFDAIGTEFQGSFRYAPEIQQIVAAHCGYRNVQVRDPATGAIGYKQSLNSLERIPFDVEGKPMAVPRVSTSRLYSGSLLGSR